MRYKDWKKWREFLINVKKKVVETGFNLKAMKEEGLLSEFDKFIISEA